MKLYISFGRQRFELDISEDCCLGDLKLRLSEITSVQPERQTLTSKDVRFKRIDDESTLASIGVKDGSAIMMIGSPAAAVDLVQQAAAREQRRLAHAAHTARHMQAQAQLETAVLNASVRFQAIESLPEFAHAREDINSAAALRLLHSLARDQGILHIMHTHNWTVGTLKEFKPSLETGLVGVTSGCLLGYNQGKGQVIALRLRTDDLEGFRYYDVIIKTLLHELAHMVHSDHDTHFHALNRQLNKEYKAHVWKRSGGHDYDTPISSDAKERAAAAALERASKAKDDLHNCKEHAHVERKEQEKTEHHQQQHQHQQQQQQQQQQHQQQQQQQPQQREQEEIERQQQHHHHEEIQQQQAQPVPQPSSSPLALSQHTELAHLVAQLSQSGRGLLLRILENLVSHPTEFKFQRVKLASRAFREATRGGADHVIQLLLHAGFARAQEDSLCFQAMTLEAAQNVCMLLKS